jgi:hypothetical protein
MRPLENQSQDTSARRQREEKHRGSNMVHGLKCREKVLAVHFNASWFRRNNDT